MGWQGPLTPWPYEMISYLLLFYALLCSYEATIKEYPLLTLPTPPFSSILLHVYIYIYPNCNYSMMLVSLIHLSRTLGVFLDVTPQSLGQASCIYIDETFRLMF